MSDNNKSPKSNSSAAHYDGQMFYEKRDGAWTLKKPSLEEQQFRIAKNVLMIFLPLLIFIGLLCSLPARRWARIKHPYWEGRHDVSIGAYGACSEDYKIDMAWATKPLYSHCTQAHMDACFAAAMPACTNSSDPDYYSFADLSEANKKYEAAWTLCRSKCSTQKWHDRCVDLGCQGVKHREQCFAVTLVEKGLSAAKVIYQPRDGGGTAWSSLDNTLSGDCRPLNEICDNHLTLKHVGNLGFAGSFCAVFGLGLLLLFIVKFDDKLPVFLASLGYFFLSWLLVLISWSVFAAELHKEVTCTVVDSVAWGCGLSATSTSMCAVQAKGDFGDLVDPGSTFGVAVGCWILLTIVLIIMLIWLKYLLKKPEPETSQI